MSTEVTKNDNIEEEGPNPLADLIVPSDTEEAEPPKPIIEGTFTFKEEESSESSEEEDDDEDDDEGIEIGKNPDVPKPTVKKEELIPPTTTKKAKTIQIAKGGTKSPEKESPKKEETTEKVITDDFWGKPIVYKKQNNTNKKKKDEPAFEDEKQFEADLKTSIVEKEAEAHLNVKENDKNDDEFVVEQNTAQPTVTPDLEAIKKKIKEEDSKIPEIPKGETSTTNNEEIKSKVEEKPKEKEKEEEMEDIKPLTSIPLTELSKILQKDANKIETDDDDDEKSKKDKDKKKKEAEKEPEFLVDKKKELDAIVEDDEGDEEEDDEDSENENTQTITQSNIEITIPDNKDESVDNLEKVKEENEGEGDEEEDEFIKREKRLLEDQKAFELNTKQITFANQENNNSNNKKELTQKPKAVQPQSQQQVSSNSSSNRPKNLAKYKDMFNYFTKLDKSKYNNSIVIDDVSGYGCFAVFTLPKLHPNLQQTLPNIFLIAKCPINENDLHYLSLLQAIYCNITDSSKEVTRYGGHWVGIGFQGSDPGTDTRDTGTYGLLQLLYLSESNQELIHNLYVLSNDVKQNFPLCCVGINITLALLKLLRERKLYKICNKYNSIEDAMNLIYCACMYKFYLKWKEEKLTIDKFQYALEFVTYSAEKKAESMIQEYTSSLKS